MSELIQIDNPKERAGISRREILRRIALGLTAAGIGRLDRASAQHVHEEVKRGKAADGTYTPQLLTDHEFNTVKRLAELIVPADEKGPSAADAGAPEFIDLLCSQNDKLARIYTGGLGWMDARMRQDHETTFVEASESQQTALLDLLVEAERAAARSTMPGVNPSTPIFAITASKNARTSPLASAFSTGCARCRSMPTTPAKWA